METKPPDFFVVIYKKLPIEENSEMSSNPSLEVAFDAIQPGLCTGQSKLASYKKLPIEENPKMSSNSSLEAAFDAHMRLSEGN